MIRCNNCGAESSEENNFCQQCGATFSQYVICTRCGHRNSKDATFCNNCSNRLRPMPEVYYKKRTNKNTVKLAFVLLALILIIPVTYLAIDNYYSCEVKVTITSTHITETVDYYIYIDGQQKASGTVEPGKTWIWTLNPSWSLLDGETKEITIKATSQGGGLGSQSDSTKITVTNNGTYETRPLFI